MIEIMAETTQCESNFMDEGFCPICGADPAICTEPYKDWSENCRHFPPLKGV